MLGNVINNIYGFLKLSLSNILPVKFIGNQMEDIYNFLKISDAIATSGQPTAAQFSAIQESGYQVVVNLAPPTSSKALSNEKQIVESQGMQYVNIPVEWENPTVEDVTEFFNVMEANTDKKVFVHCIANMRVSAFMYLYRCLHEDMNESEAKKDLQKIWMPNQTWQKFIQEVTENYR